MNMGTAEEPRAEEEDCCGEDSEEEAVVGVSNREEPMRGPDSGMDVVCRGVVLEHLTHGRPRVPTR